MFAQRSERRFTLRERQQVFALAKTCIKYMESFLLKSRKYKRQKDLV